MTKIDGKQEGGSNKSGEGSNGGLQDKSGGRGSEVKRVVSVTG